MKRIRDSRTRFFLVLAVATGLLSVRPVPSAAKLSASPEQEGNFRILIQEMNRIDTPAGDRLRDLYIQAHQAVGREDEARVRKLASEVEDAFQALPPRDQDRLLTLLASFSRGRTESGPRDPGVDCTADCPPNGSCTGTLACACVLGIPICTDYPPVPALPAWAPLGLAGVLIGGVGWLGLRRRRMA